MSNSTVKTPFYETRSLFINYLGYTDPLSYNAWNALPAEDKAAALFVQFFDQIIYAWYKQDTFLRYSTDEDGVSTVLQYLQKNVAVLEKDPKKYTAAYIYRVSYNCLYCICHDIKSAKERGEKETSNIVEGPDGPMNLFDFLEAVCEDSCLSDLERIDFWNVVGDDKNTLAIVDELIGEKPAAKRISDEKRASIISDLRIKLAKFAPAFQ
jgi:hypothetical protein